MLNNLTPVQAFGAGFVSGAVVGSLATYFVCRPSADERKAIDAFNASKPKA